MTSSSSIIPSETLLVSVVIVAAPSFNNDGRPPDKNYPSFSSSIMLQVQKQIVYGLKHRHSDNKTLSIQKATTKPSSRCCFLLEQQNKHNQNQEQRTTSSFSRRRTCSTCSSFVILLQQSKAADTKEHERKNQTGKFARKTKNKHLSNENNITAENRNEETIQRS